MMRISFIAWSTLILALIAWGGVGFFAWTISGEEGGRVSRLTASQHSMSDAANAARAHALAQDTAEARGALTGLLNVDVVSVADTVESAGRGIGVQTKVASVLPEAAPPSSGGPPVHAVGFVVTADGKFSSLMRAVQLFETLPIPSQVERLDISQTPNSGDASTPDSWHINIYIRVLTTSAISS